VLRMKIDLFKGMGMWTAIFLVVLLVGGVVASKTADTPDSPLEQAIEGIIKTTTNVDIDFSKEEKQESKDPE